MYSTDIGDISAGMCLFIFTNILNDIVEDIQYCSSFSVYRRGKKSWLEFKNRP